MPRTIDRSADHDPKPAALRIQKRLIDRDDGALEGDTQGISVMYDGGFLVVIATPDNALPDTVLEHIYTLVLCLSAHEGQRHIVPEVLAATNRIRSSIAALETREHDTQHNDTMLLTAVLPSIGIIEHRLATAPQRIAHEMLQILHDLDALQVRSVRTIQACSHGTPPVDYRIREGIRLLEAALIVSSKK